MPPPPELGEPEWRVIADAASPSVEIETRFFGIGDVSDWFITSRFKLEHLNGGKIAIG